MSNEYLAFKIRQERIEGIINGWNYYRQKLVEYGIEPSGVLPKFFAELSDIIYRKKKIGMELVNKRDLDE